MAAMPGIPPTEVALLLVVALLGTAAWIGAIYLIQKGVFTAVKRRRSDSRPGD